MSQDKISSRINSQEKSFNRILEEAAAESRRISLTIQKIAEPTSCKGVHFSKRINIHNRLFSDYAHTLKGFAENKDGKICVAIEQPFIRADREASIEEIAGALALMGFIPMCDGEYFTSGEIDIFDARWN